MPIIIQKIGNVCDLLKILPRGGNKILQNIFWGSITSIIMVYLNIFNLIALKDYFKVGNSPKTVKMKQGSTFTVLYPF